MAAKKKVINPFYVLLVIIGIVFTVTACAYGVMAVRGLHPETAALGDDSDEGLMGYLDKNGLYLLAGEIAVLAVFTIAAMVTDDYWERRAMAAELRSAESDKQENPPFQK